MLNLTEKLLQDSIEEQLNTLLFSKTNYTLILKKCSLQAHLNICKKESEKFFNYLILNSRSGGFQNKLFKEYCSLVKKELPFFCVKNNKKIVISDIMDPLLNIFDGISEFESEVDHLLKIKNRTKEYYIGGRKGTLAQPFYIGDVVSIFTKEKDIMNLIDYYTFNFIKVKNILPGTKVLVKHLRCYPHYQMGAMTYINRARKSIIDCLEQT